MKSGLEGRNNPAAPSPYRPRCGSLNEVRPRRPEQSSAEAVDAVVQVAVSMKSGLEGRNNPRVRALATFLTCRLNEVRPRRPEQLGHHRILPKRAGESQ